ncbi:6075_t:CDS:2 [Scutellospora calospora]|uniref:6075_t:CDS:1 n=1 Tax=Scutellospora calospora TaxID=85575 RepID=A0ACA9KTP9_9GLOM|nr:6075_t:CDS:2 [Scutellospora calospora]
MPLLRNGIKLDGSVHEMTYKDDKDIKRPKGIKRVLEESETKRYARLDYNYTFKDLKKAVPKALDSVNLIKIHWFAYCSACFMSVYELGLSRKTAVNAVKKYHSHRRILEKVLKEFIYD